jgi:transglutaminase-like putative cysteine protease
MEQLSTVLSLSVTALAACAGFIFAAAEGATLPLLSAPIGMVGWLLADHLHQLQLPRWVMNLGGLVAGVLALLELASGSIEARILSGGHLLVYLAWLFLLQRKDQRVVWWLLALSLLQVAVSSVLTSAPWFGVSLFGWLLLAIWTASVFTMERAVAQTQKRQLASIPVIELPLSAATAPAVSSFSIAGLRPDDRFRLLSGRFVSCAIATALAGLLISTLFFALIPRVWMSRLRFFDDSALGAIRSIGYVDQVRLGDIGEMMANRDVAFDARFARQPGHRNMTGPEVEGWLGESPLFRAKTLELYQKGRWQPAPRRGVRALPDPPGGDLVQVDIDLKFTGARTLITVGRTAAVTTYFENAQIERRILTDEYFHSDDYLNDRFSYTVYSYWNDPPRILQSLTESLEALSQPGLRTYDRSLLQMPDDLEGVRKLAESVLAGTEASTEARARRLESYLRDNDQFRYSTNLTVNDLRIDPLEDFLIKRREGHCEYFASALAMMLRASGIPSRLVTGFKGGHWDAPSNRYVVQQRHSHVWVEARIGTDWITLDPTPAARDEIVHTEDAENESVVTRMSDFLTSLWANGIGMTGTQQRDMIYTPLGDHFRSTWNQLKDFRRTSRSLATGVLDILKNPSRCISWKGGLTVFVLLTSLAAAVQSLIRGIRRFRLKTTGPNSGDGSRVRIPFYEQYREIVGRQGLQPRDFQTTAEFAATVQSALADRLQAAGLAGLTERITNAFYSERFGDRPVSVVERDRIDQELQILDDCLSAAPIDTSHNHDLRPR